MTINILHFSDLHFKSSDTKLQNLKDKILNQLENKDIDFIIFSGDLLQKPSEEEFKKVIDEFITPLLLKTKLHVDNCLFTIGNHDVDLDKRDDVVFDGLKVQIIEKKNKKTILEIINGKRKIDEVENYLKFINNLNQKSLIKNNSLYTTNKIESKGMSIGHVAMNTSLFMEGSEKDYGNLYLDENLLIQAYNEIKTCTIKILNLHHPLDWLQNKKEIEKLALDKFNIVFFGHEHQHDGYHITDMYNKDIVSLNATSLYHLKNGKNGFSIYKYSIDECKLLIEKNEFNKQHNIFETIQLDPIENINLMKKAPKAVRNKHLCSIIYPNLKEYVNKYLAINLTSEKNNHDIENIYAHPKIVEQTEKKEENKKEENGLSLDEIIKYQKNIIVTGKKESGKTTLLNMLNIQCLKNVNDYMPINISGIELYKEDNIDIFIAKVSEYLKKFYDSKKKLNIKEMIEEKRFLFFIDDIQNLYSSLLQDIIGLNNLIIGSFTIKEYDIQDENLLNFDRDEFIEDNFIKLSIKPLRKKDKKTLTHNIVPVEIQEKISNKVIKTINKLKLPSNPFITTLLSWMYIEKIDIRENEPQIIDVFLDYLLEKADLSKTFEGKIDFNDKKDILSAIAYTYFSNNSLAIKEDKILKAIIDYSEQHFPFDIDARDILNYFYQRRILIRNNNLVQFSYRVFYYYFITLYMMNNKDFYQSVVTNKYYIINMIDELKYYSALKRDDINFLEQIKNYIELNKMQTYFLKLPKIEQEPTGLIDMSENIEDAESTDIDEKNNIIPDQNRTELQEAIDEIKTDKREKKVDSYNQEKVLQTERLKSIKEEFFILNMIYSEFVKHLSGNTIEKENKERFFLNSIENYVNIIRYWEEVFNNDTLIKRFFQLKFPNDQNISDEELNDFKNFLKVDVMHMITSISNMTLSTPKMTHFYSNLLKSQDSNIYEKFFALIFSIETINEQENIVQLINLFIHHNHNNTLNNLLKIKLYNIIGDRQINSKLQLNIKKILIQLEYKINNLSDDKSGRRKKEVIEVVEKNIEIAKLIA